MMQKDINSMAGRRAFLSKATKLAGASFVLALPGVSFGGKLNPIKEIVTVKQIIEIIKKEIPDAAFSKTVDQVRFGSLEQEVTGIVTTMFPTIDVIKKTARIGANFIIAHETIFYNHEDEIGWLEKDEVYHQKIALLETHKIAIWRFHDYWHAHKPDGIIMGNLIKLGWDKYYNPENPRIITLPKPMTLESIVALTKKKLGIPSVRVAGNLKSRCQTIYLAFGFMDSKRQIPAIQEFKPDLILSGETREWETVERVRDGLLLGHKTNLLVLSHSVSEEAGMEYAAKWLQPKSRGIKVTHIASGNPFQYL